MRRRDFIKTAGLLAGVSAPAVWPSRLLAADKPVSIKFDSYIAETAGPSRLDDWFLKQLETRSNGAVKVRRYWAQSLNKVGEHLSAVRDGTSEMSLISPGYYQAQLPVTRGLEWYYRMNRADALHLVCRDVYEQFQPLRDEWKSATAPRSCTGPTGITRRWSRASRSSRWRTSAASVSAATAWPMT